VRCRSNCAGISTEDYSPSLPDPLLRTSVAFGGEDGIGISAKQKEKALIRRHFSFISLGGRDKY